MKLVNITYLGTREGKRAAQITASHSSGALKT